MAYTVINSTRYDVGKAIKQELFSDIVTNLGDHETRIASLETGGASLILKSEDILIGTTGVSLTSVFDVICPFNLSVTEFAIYLYDTTGISGTISVDLKKNTTTNQTGMSSLLTTPISTSTLTSYSKITATMNPSTQACLAGDVLRFSIPSIPVGLLRFHVFIKGEY